MKNHWILRNGSTFSFSPKDWDLSYAKASKIHTESILGIVFHPRAVIWL